MKKIRVDYENEKVYIVEKDGEEKPVTIEELTGDFFVDNLELCFNWFKHELFKRGYKGIAMSKNAGEKEFKALKRRSNKYLIETRKFKIISFANMYPRYAITDAKTQYEIMEKLEEEGLQGCTIGSAVRHLWLYKEGGIKWVKGKRYNTKEFTAEMNYFVAESLKGGLCLQKEKGEYEVSDTITIDINHLYPWIACVKLLPYWTPKFISYDEFCKSVRYSIGIYMVDIHKMTIKPGKVAWFGTRTRHVEELQYNDEVKPAMYYIWSYEFDALLKDYDIDYDIYNVLAFQSIIGDFKPFIEKYEAKKENSEGIARQIYKNINNNFLGKFATNNDVQDVEVEEGTFMQELNDSTEYYPALFSAVCAWGRTTLATYINNYIKEPKKNFAYSDTDSITAKRGSFSRFLPLDDKKMGYFKIESENKGFRCFGAKKYCKLLKDGSSKSVISGCTKQVDYNDFVKGNIIEFKIWNTSGIIPVEVTKKFEL